MKPKKTTPIDLKNAKRPRRQDSEAVPPEDASAEAENEKEQERAADDGMPEPDASRPDSGH